MLNAIKQDRATDPVYPAYKAAFDGLSWTVLKSPSTTDPPAKRASGSGSGSGTFVSGSRSALAPGQDEDVQDLQVDELRSDPDPIPEEAAPSRTRMRSTTPSFIFVDGGVIAKAASSTVQTQPAQLKTKPKPRPRPAKRITPASFAAWLSDDDDGDDITIPRPSAFKPKTKPKPKSGEPIAAAYVDLTGLSSDLDVEFVHAISASSSAHLGRPLDAPVKVCLFFSPHPRLHAHSPTLQDEDAVDVPSDDSLHNYGHVPPAAGFPGDERVNKDEVQIIGESHGFGAAHAVAEGVVKLEDTGEMLPSAHEDGLAPAATTLQQGMADQRQDDMSVREEHRPRPCQSLKAGSETEHDEEGSSVIPCLDRLAYTRRVQRMYPTFLRISSASGSSP
jgi:hypothetical protein